MARRKKPIEETVEKPTSKPIAKKTSFQVKRKIVNPLRLSMSLILSDDKPFTLTEAQLADEMFMTHINHLISLEKLERV